MCYCNRVRVRLFMNTCYVEHTVTIVLTSSGLWHCTDLPWSVLEDSDNGASHPELCTVPDYDESEMYYMYLFPGRKRRLPQ